MAQRTRRELQGRSPVSTTTVHGGCSILFGLPFLLIGCFVTAMALDVIPQPDSQFPSGRGPAVGAGLLFAGVGLLMLFHGIRGFLRKRAVAARAAVRPNEPWYFDYPWNPEGVRFSGLGEMRKKLWFALVWLGFTAGFGYLMFRSSVDTFGVVFIGIFTLVGIGVFVWAIYDFLRWCKFGSSRLRFGRFPFLQGETLEAYWSVPRGIKTYNSIEITLRAIEEKYETRGSGDNRSQQVVMYELYIDRVRFDQEGELPAGNEELPITFPVPTDVPPTLLSERPPVYWEVEVKADAPGIDYYARFLVPVYARGA